MTQTHANQSDSWLVSIIVLVLAVLILGASLVGFGMKFFEFIMVVYGDEEGVFAVTPIVNYLLASLGFLCLLGWAAAHGMFHDIEQPKRTMLDIERQLDEASGTVPQSRNEKE